MRRRIIAGNWKMNGALERNRALVMDLLAGLPADPACDVVVCPSAVYLAQLQTLLRGQNDVSLGAQDASEHAQGAYTGSISLAMLQEFGVRFVIVGHSERRRDQHESDLTVGAKVRAVLAAGLTPIACVGETAQQREQGLGAFVVQRQLGAILAMNAGMPLDQLVLAYEPVWAIGTGQTATPEQAQGMHAAMRMQLRQAGMAADEVRILYGGSMKPDNAADLLAQPDVDGGLIGGAALKAVDFLQIVQAAGERP